MEHFLSILIFSTYVSIWAVSMSFEMGYVPIISVFVVVPHKVRLFYCIVVLSDLKYIWLFVVYMVVDSLLLLYYINYMTFMEENGGSFLD